MPLIQWVMQNLGMGVPAFGSEGGVLMSGAATVVMSGFIEGSGGLETGGSASTSASSHGYEAEGGMRAHGRATASWEPYYPVKIVVIHRRREDPRQEEARREASKNAGRLRQSPVLPDPDPGQGWVPAGSSWPVPMSDDKTAAELSQLRETSELPPPEGDQGQVPAGSSEPTYTGDKETASQLDKLRRTAVLPDPPGGVKKRRRR